MTAHNLYVKFAPILTQLGYQPTPCDGKRPILHGWQHNPAQAHDYDRYPDHNIGLVLGGPHNVACIDIDVTDPQCSADLVRLAREEWPGAPIRIGRKPKAALFIRTSEPISKIKTALYTFNRYPGDQAVEILAAGQQAIVAGYHPDGHRYTWHDDKLTDIEAASLPVATPQDIDLYIRQANTILASYGQAKARASAQTAMKALPFATNPLEGDLHEITSALAQISNNDRHYDDYVAMAHAIKGAVGEDGWPLWEQFSRQSQKHDDRECSRIWRSIGEVREKGAASIFYEAIQNGWRVNRQPVEAAQAEKADAADTPQEPPQSPQTPESDPADYWDSGDDEPQQAVKKTEQAKAKKPGLEMLDADAIQPVLNRVDMVQNLIAPGQTSLTFGESNAGKTWFALDLALHVAMKAATWAGRRIKGGPVVYIAGEGAHGVVNRIAAFKRGYGIESGFQMKVVPHSINMRDPIHDPRQDFLRLIEACQAVEEEYGEPIQLIVVDTLARAMSGGNENSSEDMGALIAVVDELRRQTGAHIMMIHHSGKDKDKGMRGHSSLHGAADTIIGVEKAEHGNYSIARVIKQRDMEIDDTEMVFSLSQVTLGQNTETGEDVTSCVVVHDLDGSTKAEAASAVAAKEKQSAARRKPRGANKQIVWKQALNFLSETGSTLPGYIQAPAAAVGCAEDDLRNYCRGKFSSPKHFSTDFRKALDGLAGEEFLVRDGGYVWWVRDD